MTSKIFLIKNLLNPKKAQSLSCPNRVVIVYLKTLDKFIKIKSEEIRGPNVDSPPPMI